MFENQDSLPFTYISNDSEISYLINDIQTTPERIGLDIEASSLDPLTSVLLLIQIATQKDNYVINAGTISKKTQKYIFELIADRKIEVVGHNIKFDVKTVYSSFGILLENLFDTMLAEVMAFPGISNPFTSLGVLVQKYARNELTKGTRESFIGKTDFDFTEDQIKYAAEDVAYLFVIASTLEEKIEERDQIAVWNLEKKLEPVVAMMELEGIGFDKKQWFSLAEQAEKNQKEVIANIYDYLIEHFDIVAGTYDNALDVFNNLNITTLDDKPVKAKFRQKLLEEMIIRDDIVSTAVSNINLGSSKQVTKILRNLGLNVEKSSEKELNRVKENPFVTMLLENRHYTKRIDAFGEDYLRYVHAVTGRIHAEFNQLRAATGRFSLDNPNLQQVIAESQYRKAFIARPGYLIETADYNQIELRTMAEVSGEELMLTAFNNVIDLHKLTASIIFEIPIEKVTETQRRIGKTVNFAIIYGTTEYGLSKNFGWSLEEGKEYLKRFFDQYFTMAQFIDIAGAEILRRRYSTTLLGRKRFFTIPEGLNYKNWEFRAKLSRIKRQGINHIIQGTCADIMKLALVLIYFDSPFEYEMFHILLTVHDEVAVEYHESIKDKAHEFIIECMTTAGEHFLKKVPITIGYQIDHFWRK